MLFVKNAWLSKTNRVLSANKPVLLQYPPVRQRLTFTQKKLLPTLSYIYFELPQRDQLMLQLKLGVATQMVGLLMASLFNS